MVLRRSKNVENSLYSFSELYTVFTPQENDPVSKKIVCFRKTLEKYTRTYTFRVRIPFTDCLFKYQAQVNNQKNVNYLLFFLTFVSFQQIMQT